MDMEVCVDDDSAHLTRNAVLELIKQKDEIEANIRQLTSVLEQNKNVGMHGDLIDNQGFPRSDIDVYQVRHARHRIICLQNDHKALMQQIESGLHDVHAEIRKTNIERFTVAGENNFEATGEPFVRVNLVVPNSPAEHAGLQLEDLIVEFGTVNWRNFKDLQDVNKVVQASVNMPIHVKVRRQGTYVSLRLTPKTWSGRGLLGCNIIPVENVER
ncbi:26S proteasome non-ATPase regulatory subunit 9 [Cloeon dipterum]